MRKFREFYKFVGITPNMLNEIKTLNMSNPTFDQLHSNAFVLWYSELKRTCKMRDSIFVVCFEEASSRFPEDGIDTAVYDAISQRTIENCNLVDRIFGCFY